MAIRRAQDGPPSTSPSAAAGRAGPDLVTTLQNAGLLGGGRDPLKTAATLLGNLVAKGFGAPGANLEAALKTALVAFQRASGLPATGVLDARTMAALEARGLLPGQGVHSFQDGFEAKRSAPKTDTPAPPAPGLVETATKLVENLGRFLGGLFGARGGTDKAGGADRPPDGKAGASGDGAGTTTASGHQAAESADRARARVDGGTQDPTTRGVLQGDPLAQAGRAPPGTDAGHSGGADAAKGAKKDHGQGDGTDGADADGTEDSDGNARSGDDVDDDERGHAAEDDGRRDGAGYYRVPSFAKQAERVLDGIVRDADQGNRAATYSLDVTFRVPGVYGPGQSPEVVLHLVVQSAGAGDPVWTSVAEKLSELVGRDRSGLAPDVEDLRAALRVARYRSP